MNTSLRADAMLLTHGRSDTGRLSAAALLLDALRSGHLDVLEGRRLVAGPQDAGDPSLLADLRARVLAGSPGSPITWIERTAQLASHQIAAELVTAGVAAPLGPRFGRGFTLSVDARAEAAARERIATDPALAGLLYTYGFPTGDPLPPPTYTLAPPERAILAALRQTVSTASAA